MRPTNIFQLSCVLVTLLALSACEKLQVKPTPPAAPTCACPVQPAPTSKPGEVKPEPVKVPDYSLLKPADWQELEAITKDDVTKAWPAWKLGCASLKVKPAWQAVCKEADKLESPSQASILDYFKNNFVVYRTTNLDGSNTGMITGYYEPVIKGSRIKTDKFRFPLYTRPDDLITVELASLFPELANLSLIHI